MFLKKIQISPFHNLFEIKIVTLYNERLNNLRINRIISLSKRDGNKQSEFLKKLSEGNTADNVNLYSSLSIREVYL